MAIESIEIAYNDDNTGRIVIYTLLPSQLCEKGEKPEIRTLGRWTAKNNHLVLWDGSREYTATVERDDLIKGVLAGARKLYPYIRLWNALTYTRELNKDKSTITTIGLSNEITL